LCLILNETKSFRIRKSFKFISKLFKNLFIRKSLIPQTKHLHLNSKHIIKQLHPLNPIIMRISILRFFCIVFLCSLYACGGETPEQNKGDDMAKFTKDEKFKEAHETPEKIDFKAKGDMITFKTSDGTEGSAYALGNDMTTKKALLVIHEWYGLNDHIKQEAERLFGELEGVKVMALDLYDGNVADNRDDASKFMQAVKEERVNAIIQGAMDHLGEDTKVATIGWCFGGGWSLKSSILAGEQGAGCVMYYGAPVLEPAKLAPIKADVLGLFAKKDGWITPEMVTKFETAMKAIGKNVTTKQFDADHAFANPSSPRYHEAAAQEANAMALAFLKERL